MVPQRVAGMCGDATTASLAGIQSEESRNAFFKGKNQESADVGAKRPQEAMSAGVSDDSGHNKKVKIDDGLQEDDLGKSGCRHALDFRRGRLDYASVGVLRTKPGRVDSEPTLSMSCSDKMARWSILGLTSGLVAPFLAPIYLTSVITMELFDEEALERALSGRLKTCDCLDVTSEKQYRPHPVIVCSTDIPFEYSKDKVTMVDQNLNKEELSSIPMPVASAASISWISGSLGSEVLVNGCKAGASAKKQIPPKSRSQICKMGMLQSAVALWTTVSETHGVPMPLEPATAPYSAWKGLSEAYVKTREQLHDTVLKNWARSNDELEQFTLSS
ncbi:hypothetical protein BGZ94_007740 [Podila epigama]|nr:hypothetical protein BGZ94_007740 [Podila epigama]